MAGGLMQLIAYGSQDIFLTGNPQITFFKAVFRRHTNFSMEVIERHFTGTVDFGNKLSATFSRDGDLLTKMYIKVVLDQVDPDGSNFAWIRRLGHAIIDQVDIQIGNTKMDTHIGIWLNIWYELARVGDHERGYAHIIGDIPELTEYNKKIKEEYTLYIPLQFWFNRYIGLSIPIIALQYHKVNIYVRFSPKEQLVIRDNNFDMDNVTIKDASILTNYVYLDTDERKRFAQVGHEYLIEQNQHNGHLLVTHPINSYKLDYNFPTKEIIWAMTHDKYISGRKFLFYTHKDSWTDTDETDPTSVSVLEEASKKIIADSLSFTDPTGSVGGIWFEVTGTTIAVVGNINITNNFATSIFVNSTSVSIGSYGITDKIFADVTVSVAGVISISNVVTSLTVRDFSFPTDMMTDTRANQNDPTVYMFHNYGILIDGSVNPVEFGLLKFNGHDRFDRREGTYFNNVQPDQHHTNIPVDGINLYSFAINPEEHQPSGSANLTRIDSVVLRLWFKDSTFKSGLPDFNLFNDGNKLYVFAVNHNIMRVLSGMSGIAYQHS